MSNPTVSPGLCRAIGFHTLTAGAAVQRQPIPSRCDAGFPRPPRCPSRRVSTVIAPRHDGLDCAPAAATSENRRTSCRAPRESKEQKPRRPAEILSSPRRALAPLALGELAVGPRRVNFLEALCDAQFWMRAAIRFGLVHQLGIGRVDIRRRVGL
jgi:hypothetical protein